VAVEVLGADVMAQTTIVINPQAMAELLGSEHGPVMRNMAIRATNVQRLAKTYVGYSKISFTGEHLRDEIVKRFVQTDRGPGIAIGVFGKDAQRALYHEQGTQPHIIRPRDKKALAFIWSKAANFAQARVLGAGYVVLKLVHHPGTRATNFLRRALNEGINA
jgi:hypothetical protein